MRCACRVNFSYQLSSKDKEMETPPPKRRHPSAHSLHRRTLNLCLLSVRVFALASFEIQGNLVKLSPISCFLVLAKETEKTVLYDTALCFTPVFELLAKQLAIARIGLCFPPFSLSSQTMWMCRAFRLLFYSFPNTSFAKTCVPSSIPKEQRILKSVIAVPSWGLYSCTSTWDHMY